MTTPPFYSFSESWDSAVSPDSPKHFDWSWCMASDISHIAAASLARQKVALNRRDEMPTFDLRNYVCLNAPDNRAEVLLTWCLPGSDPNLFHFKDHPDRCPFSDARLFLPAGFAMKVIRAVECGAKAVEWDRSASRCRSERALRATGFFQPQVDLSGKKILGA
jgi:hypothetical protein